MQTAVNFDKIAATDNWTLKDDIELKDALELCKNNFLKNLDELDRTNDQMERKMFELETRLEHVNNRINCMKIERFIEEKVDEFTDLISSRKQMASSKETRTLSRAEYEERTIQSITCAIHKALDLFKSANPQIQAGIDPVDPTTSSNSNVSKTEILIDLHAENFYKIRALPPIIGSEEFAALMQTRNPVELPKTIPENLITAGKTQESSSASILRNKEEDIASTSSGKSVPPQDPLPVPVVLPIPADVKMAQQRNALLEEIVSRKAPTAVVKKPIHESTESRPSPRPVPTQPPQSTKSAPVSKPEQIENTKPIQSSQPKLQIPVEAPPKTAEQPKPVEATPTVQEAQQVHEDDSEMSKPVFKPFDSAFSDRLAAALQHGPITLRPDRGPTCRPQSVHSLSSNSCDEAPRPLRKTESSVSSNEELGPASVKARIAQIGSKIPTARGRSMVEASEDTENRRVEQQQEKAAPMPTVQAEALKTRAKGPARRAPTQMSANAKPPPSVVPSKRKEEERPKPMATIPQPKTVPPVPPKKKEHSIFSSSSSEDDLRFTTTKKAAAPNPLPKSVPREEAKSAADPSNGKTKINTKPSAADVKNEPAKRRKGLFDDTDSDF